MNNLKFKKLKIEISNLSCKDNICCFLLHGSILNQKKYNDADIIIIVKDINKDVSEFFQLVFRYFKNPDFHIYSIDEIENDISFFTRQYVMEYLAQAECIFGFNIFQSKFKKVTDLEYRSSILIRSIEHVQMVRKVYYSNKYDKEYKINYLKKYTIRLAKNILLFKRIYTYNYLSSLSYTQIKRLLIRNKLLEYRSLRLNSKNSLNNHYNIFCSLGNNLIFCKKHLNKVSRNKDEFLIDLIYEKSILSN